MHTQPEAAYTESKMLPEHNGAAQQNELSAFINRLQQKYSGSVTATDAFITVQLETNIVYRLQPEYTYQEVATPNEKLLQQLTQELDEQGIEYEVLKNNGDAVLLCKGEWVVSWGGILYLPHAVTAF